jgi:hypothetical protein
MKRDINLNPEASSEAPEHRVCMVCQKPMTDNVWGRHLQKESERVTGSQAKEILLCSAECALSYLGLSQPGSESLEPHYDAYESFLRVPERQNPPEAGGTKNNRENQ